MSVVVMCACNGYAPRQRPTEPSGRCGRCGVRVQVLLTLEQNQERVLRGVELGAWFAAPKTPANRNACERGPRPCPYLRCRYHLGEPGRNGCALDVAEQEPTSSDKTTHHTLDHVGAQLDVSRERTRQIEERALEKAGPLVELLAARKRKAAG